MRNIFQGISYDTLEALEGQALRRGYRGLAEAIDQELRDRIQDIASATANILATLESLSSEEE